MLWALQYAHRGRHICIYANMFYLFEKVKEDNRNSPRMPKMTCHLLRPVLSWISWSPSPISAFRPPAVQKKSMKTPQIKDIHITISSIYQRTTSTNDQAELSVHIINKDRPEPERRTVIPRPQPHRSSSQLTRFNFLRANSVPLLRLLHLCHLRPLALAALVTKRPRSKETVKYVRKRTKKDKLLWFQIVLRVGECFQNILDFETLPLDWGWGDPVPGTIFSTVGALVVIAV